MSQSKLWLRALVTAVIGTVVLYFLITLPFSHNSEIWGIIGTTKVIIRLGPKVYAIVGGLLLGLIAYLDSPRSHSGVTPLLFAGRNYLVDGKQFRFMGLSPLGRFVFYIPMTKKIIALWPSQLDEHVRGLPRSTQLTD